MHEHAPAPELPSDWRTRLETTLNGPYFKKLMNEVSRAYEHSTVYPPKEDIFRAFSLTPFDGVRVVIVGQDPYHGPGQANGLAFSVHRGVQNPPSLRNIFKEIAREYHTPVDTDGDLARFARQGVLLLNAALTVSAGAAASHRDKGWETFTDAVLKKLSDEREHLVFMLWGNDARKKGAIIDRTKHLVLESAHPSPLSAHRGFLGNDHFMKANTYLAEHSETPIDWID